MEVCVDLPDLIQLLEEFLGGPKIGAGGDIGMGLCV